MNLTQRQRTPRERDMADRWQPTARSISDARLAQFKERQQFTAETGLRFDPAHDGRLVMTKRDV